MTFGKAEVHLKVLTYFAKIFGALGAFAALLYAVTSLFSAAVAVFLFIVLPLAAGLYYLIYSTYETEMITDRAWEEAFKPSIADQFADQADQLRNQK